MNISNNINRNLLLIFFLSALIATFTTNVILIVITAFIGFILLSNIYTTEPVDDSLIPNNHCSFDHSVEDISFFDDFSSDD